MSLIMYLELLYMILASPLAFGGSNIGYTETNEVDNFIEMVLSNLTAASRYVLPVDNRNLYYVEPSEEHKFHDYGEFDFVIIGGGSAGTLLANRLTEIKKWNVLLLEAGGRENDFSDIPGMSNELSLSDMNWGYKSTSQEGGCLAMDEHRCVVTRGKVLGGCSTINAKMYVRGNKEDYNEWEKMGNKGWSYRNVLPYFIKTEHSDIGDGDLGYHGVDGLLHVSYTEPTPFTKLFLKASEDIGQECLDYNGRKQIGASRVQFTIKGNKIASGGRAFIDPLINRRNLNVTLNAFVTKLLINKKTKTALGAEFIMNGKKFIVKASREILLSAGAINSPQILMLSGIGPKEELDKIGVDTLLDLPVGKNMEDHALFIGLNFRTNLTMFNESKRILLKDYLNNHRPYTAAGNVDTLSFINVNDNKSTVPDIQQILIVPPGLGSDAQKIINLDKKIANEDENQSPFNDIVVWLALLHPKSKGSVTLKSKSPVDFPIIDYNYFAVAEDIDTMYKGVLETLKLLETKPFKSINASYSPMAKICTEFTELSKEYWYCIIKHFTTTLYHPVGTTRMGNTTKNSVVRSDLRVHGMKNLRVIDAGVIPKIPSGNTNAPTYMIAEKIAHEIKRHFIKKLI